MHLASSPIDPPVIGGLTMPADLWWFTQVAAEITGADPGFVAAVLRFESDFRCGPIGRGTYVGPGGLHKMFTKKYPIYQKFGNVLTVARRLGQFDNYMIALRGYNKDRSSKFQKYCNAVIGNARRIQRSYIKPLNDPAWKASVTLGRIKLIDLELRVANYQGGR